jgi:hypothetical protein
MTIPQPPQTPAPLGNNKAYAAAFAGAFTVIVAWALTYAHITAPAEVVAAFQTLITLAAVYVTPHGG